MADLTPPTAASAEAQETAAMPAAAGLGSASIVTHVKRAILEGAYAYNERLPPERELATHFGASRGTVREALRQLEELGLVTRRVGSGTFVSHRRENDPNDIAEVTGPLELIDVRTAIEPYMTRLAVVNASARDLERLREALERVEAAEESESFSRADEAFHAELARCTQNPLIAWLYAHINDVRGHRQWDAMKDQILSPERIREYNHQHRSLYVAISTRDVERAVRTIVEHLEKARRDLMGASRV